MFSLELNMGHGKFSTFQKSEENLRSVGESKNIYYLNGAENEANKYESNGEIIVSFEKNIDLENFQEKFSLKLKRKISKQFETYLFLNSSSLDDGTLCEKVGKEKNIRFSYPNWKSKKKLY
ncbi:MAG: hypothetical protein OIF32_06505 [Campylobacterales bacterium]|nr:hypothetical protein [Campylobacterales bacterium]